MPAPMAGGGDRHKNLERRHLRRKFLGEWKLRMATASTREAGVQCARPGLDGCSDKTWEDLGLHLWQICGPHACRGWSLRKSYRGPAAKTGEILIFSFFKMYCFGFLHLKKSLSGRLLIVKITEKWFQWPHTSKNIVFAKIVWKVGKQKDDCSS